MRLLLLAALLIAACATPARPVPTTQPVPVVAPVDERLAYWRDIRAHDDAPPAGADVAALARELVGLLDSTDPEVRDGLATDVLERWIRRDARLDPAQLRELTPLLYRRLFAGLGAREADSVFGRSFSALVLSMVAARDVATPFLSDAELTEMVAAAGRYAEAEQDLRGYVPGRGWAHAGAHTADWLKWIARHPQLGPDRARTVLDAVLALTVRRHGTILAYGEDGRLAQPVLELLRLGHLDAAGFAAWMPRLAAPLFEDGGKKFDPALFAAQRNSRNLLFTLFVALSMEKAPSPAQSAALAALHALIAQ